MANTLSEYMDTFSNLHGYLDYADAHNTKYTFVTDKSQCESNSEVCILTYRDIQDTVLFDIINDAYSLGSENLGSIKNSDSKDTKENIIDDVILFNSIDEYIKNRTAIKNPDLIPLSEKEQLVMNSFAERAYISGSMYGKISWI